MVQIYRAKVDVEFPDKMVEYLLDRVTGASKEKFKRFHFKIDALRSLYGEIMVRYFIRQNYSISNDSLQFRKNASGKPYIENISLEYNISHSGEWVVCAFSQKKVGIDIEQMNQVEFAVAKRFFCRPEYEGLLAQKEEDQVSYFYTLWSLKESYIKWLGHGYIAFDSFCFEIGRQGLNLIEGAYGVKPNFKEYPMIDYKLVVCSEEEHFTEEIMEIDMRTLVRKNLL